MDRATIEPPIKILLTEVHSKTERSRTHRQGGSSLRRGRQHFRTCHYLDGQLVYEAGRPHDAASLLNRMSRE